MAGPDNSYVARAEEIFNNTRNFLSREEDSDLLGFTNQAGRLNNRNDSRLGISQ